MGVEPASTIEDTQLTHFMLRPIRQKRPKCQTEVHGGYTEHCAADASGLSAPWPNARAGP